MVALNYAQEYSQALANAYPYVLHYGALYETTNNNRYRWTSSKTIQIPSITTTGRVNGDRDAIGTAARNYDNAWEPKTLSNHRKWATLVHPADINQTAGVANIQNITESYNNDQKFPEMDAYTVSKLFADWTAAGGTATTGFAPTAENVLTQFDADMQAMTEGRVPTNGRVLYITPAVDTCIKQAQQISRQLDVQSNAATINRVVHSLDDVKIEVVPPELMKTVYDFTTGWAVGASAKQIHMFLVHPGAVITPISYEFAQLDPPSAITEGKYYYFEESFEDVFILNKKYTGLRFVTE